MEYDFNSLLEQQLKDQVPDYDTCVELAKKDFMPPTGYAIAYYSCQLGEKQIIQTLQGFYNFRTFHSAFNGSFSADRVVYAPSLLALHLALSQFVDFTTWKAADGKWQYLAEKTNQFKLQTAHKHPVQAAALLLLWVLEQPPFSQPST